MFNRTGARLSSWASWLCENLFSAQPPKWLAYGWLAGLYLLGLFLWGQFLNWGRIPYDFHDWAEISAPRIAFVRDAVMKGQLPLHMPDASALRNVTDRFMALPDVMLPPQMVLLRFLDVGTFVLANTWLLYTLGMLGLIWLARRYRLSPAAFTVLFLLLNFNGHLLAHFSVGHVNYAGTFLFSWLAAFTLYLLDCQREGRLPGRGWTAGVAFTLFYLLLNGSFHQFIWWLIFLGLVGLFNWKLLPVVLKTLLLSGLLGAVRLLPPVLEMAKFDKEFLSGYPSLTEMWNALVVMKQPSEALAGKSILTSLGWWEFDLFIGLLGAGFLLYFGLYRWLKDADRPEGYAGLLLPVTVVFALSIGRVYRLFMLIPILGGERVSARMVIVPFTFLVLLGSIAFQRWLEERRMRPAAQWALLGLLFLQLNDLWQNLKLWRVNVAAEAFPVTPVDLAMKTVANHPDAPYTTILAAGAAVSAVTAVVLIVMAIRERQKRRSRTAEIS